MIAKKIRQANPAGARRGPADFRPDRIEAFTVEAAQCPAPDPADPQAEGLTLMPFLKQALPQAKRTTLKEMLRFDRVRVNGEVTTKFNHPLAPGDLVEVNHSRPFVTFYDRRLRLVYEDDHIMVVNKGYGLLSVGTDKIKEGTAYSILREYLKAQDPRNKIFIVHRLDQHTSGLMIFAKSIEAKETLQHNWNNMVRRRQYVCLAEGRLDPPEGTIETYLAENSQHIVYCTDRPDQGQYALTRYTTLRCGNGYTLAEVELETGRKNQIRVHLQSIGHPIAGDRRYGAKTSPIHRLALHARTISFIHPITRQLLNFSTPIPASFLRTVGAKQPPQPQ